MALISCPECKKEFSDKAESCPNCGCPTNEAIGTISKETPPIEKQTKRHENIRCSVGIIGDEEFKVPRIGPVGSYIIHYGILIYLVVIPFYMEKFKFDAYILGMVILFLFLITILYVIYLIIPSYSERLEKITIINQYFKKRFIILNSFNDQEHKTLGIHQEDGKDREDVFFNIFMNAYKVNADAIILNDSSVSTSISASSSSKYGTTGGSSSNTFHITATFVKYLNNIDREEDVKERNDTKVLKKNISKLKSQDNISWISIILLYPLAIICLYILLYNTKEMLPEYVLELSILTSILILPFKITKRTNLMFKKIVIWSIYFISTFLLMSKIISTLYNINIMKLIS